MENDRMSIELEKLSAMTGQSVEELRVLITKAFEPFRLEIEKAMKASHRPVSIEACSDPRMSPMHGHPNEPWGIIGGRLHGRYGREQIHFDECVNFPPMDEAARLIGILGKGMDDAIVEPTPKPIQKNKFAFLDGLQPKRRAFNQKFYNFKGR